MSACLYVYTSDPSGRRSQNLVLRLGSISVIWRLGLGAVTNVHASLNSSPALSVSVVAAVLSSGRLSPLAFLPAVPPTAGHINQLSGRRCETNATECCAS